EAAGGEHDAVRRADRQRLAVARGPDTDDAVVLDDEVLERGAQPQVGAELLDDDVEERRRPAGPDPRELLARDDAAERAEDELRPADEPGGRGPGAAEQPHVVGLGRQRDGRLVRLPPVPDALDVEGLDLKAAADLAAGQL